MLLVAQKNLNHTHPCVAESDCAHIMQKSAPMQAFKVWNCMPCDLRIRRVRCRGWSGHRASDPSIRAMPSKVSSWMRAELGQSQPFATQLRFGYWWSDSELRLTRSKTQGESGGDHVARFAQLEATMDHRPKCALEQLLQEMAEHSLPASMQALDVQRGKSVA